MRDAGGDHLGGAAGEMVTELSGHVAEPNPAAMADGVLRVLKLPEAERRVAARAQAELHPWSRTVAGMLEVHHALAARRRWAVREPAARTGAVWSGLVLRTVLPWVDRRSARTGPAPRPVLP